MTALLSTAIAVTIWCYALAMALSLVRVMRGPSAQDRVLALDFLYVNGMLATLVLVMVSRRATNPSTRAS